MRGWLRSETLTPLVVALTVACLAGCGIGGIGVPTEQFEATVCAEGVVLVPCQALGKVEVPTGGGAIAALAVALAGPYLQKQAKLEACLFDVDALTGEEGAISVVATAACKLNGVPVTETVSITLAPVSP